MADNTPKFEGLELCELMELDQICRGAARSYPVGDREIVKVLLDRQLVMSTGTSKITGAEFLIHTSKGMDLVNRALLTGRKKAQDEDEDNDNG